MIKPSRHIDELMQAYFNGKITQEQLGTLEAWLSEDAAHVQWLVDLALLDGLLFDEQKIEDSAAVLSVLLEAEENAEPIFSLLHTPALESTSGKVDPDALTMHDVWSVARYALSKAVRTKAAIYSSVAAVLVLGTVLYISILGIGGTPHQPTSPGNSLSDFVAQPPQVKPVVATLTATRNAQWGTTPSQRDLERGSELHPGDRLVLTAGFAEITTHRGAIAILEAPATIEFFDNDNALQLHDGKLVGICETQASKGFIVNTQNMLVTDLGTRFGVSIESDGAVSTSVIEGEVEVQKVGRTAESTRIVALTAGQQIRSNASGELDQAITAIDPDHGYVTSWDAIRYRVDVQGQARFFVQPPTDISPNALIDPEHMIVFQERTAVTEAPIQVMTELSRTARGPMDANTQIPVGTEVTSYMVHFSPAMFLQGQHDGKTDPVKIVNATIVFPGRVLGLIGGGPAMSATHELLGLDSVVYVDPRNKVYNNAIDRWPTDSITITGEKQNILEIKLTAGVHSDQARVLVEVPADYIP